MNNELADRLALGLKLSDVSGMVPLHVPFKNTHNTARQSFGIGQLLRYKVTKNEIFQAVHYSHFSVKLVENE